MCQRPGNSVNFPAHLQCNVWCVCNDVHTAPYRTIWVARSAGSWKRAATDVTLRMLFRFRIMGSTLRAEHENEKEMSALFDYGIECAVLKKKMQIGWLITNFICESNNAATFLKGKQFLQMHFNFQILHFKLNFGIYLLGHILTIKSQMYIAFLF